MRKGYQFALENGRPEPNGIRLSATQPYFSHMKMAKPLITGCM